MPRGAHQRQGGQHQRPGIKALRGDRVPEYRGRPSAGDGNGADQAGRTQEQYVHRPSNRARTSRSWAAVDRKHTGDEEHSADEQAVHAVIGIARCGPGDHGAERDRVAEALVSIGPHQHEEKDGERCRGDEAEVPHPSRDEKGTPGKQQPGQPGLGQIVR